MGRLLILLAIGALVYFLFFKDKKTEIKEKNSDENEFVQCENCKTFVLKKEMKEKNGKLLCKDCYDNS